MALFGAKGGIIRHNAQVFDFHVVRGSEQGSASNSATPTFSGSEQGSASNYASMGSGSAQGSANNQAVGFRVPAQNNIIGKIYFRDSALLRRGEIDIYEEVTIVPRFNDVGYWEIQLPIDAIASQFWLGNWAAGQPLGGIIVTKSDGSTLLSGPVWHISDSSTESQGDLITFAGPDDNIVLGWRLSYPEAPATTTATSVYDQRYGVAETIMKGYVSDNLGPTAASGRQLIASIDTDLGRGIPLLSLGRFQTLLTLCRSLALQGGQTESVIPAAGSVQGSSNNFSNVAAAGSGTGSAQGASSNSAIPQRNSVPVASSQGAANNLGTPGYLLIGPGQLGFRVVQVATHLEFQVYLPTNKSNSVVLRTAGQGLREFTVDVVGPSANQLVVGGSGTGTARKFTTVIDSNSTPQWGSIESFFDDRANSDATALAQSGREQLITDGRQLALTLTANDTALIKFSKTYGIGDKISVAIHGIIYSDVVQEVTIKRSNKDAEVSSPLIGSYGQSSSPQLYTAVDGRVSDLERIQ